MHWVSGSIFAALSFLGEGERNVPSESLVPGSCNKGSSPEVYDGAVGFGKGLTMFESRTVTAFPGGSPCVVGGWEGAFAA